MKHYVNLLGADRASRRFEPCRARLLTAWCLLRRMRDMATGSIRFASLLIVGLLFLGIAGQSVASVIDSDCHCDSYDCCHHCEARAGCQSVAVPAEIRVSFPILAETEIIVSREAKLPLVLETRFIPPKR